MILRRVIAHFKRQEWTAIAIDFLIVVLGVFVGIQVANWNARRVTDERSVEFTSRLRADLAEEYWTYEYLATYYDEVLANADRTIAALDGGAPVSDEALLIGAYRATQLKIRTRRRATYDELTSTGEIGLIRDSAMRETAMGLYTTNLFDRITAQGLQSTYREAFRMAIPNEVQRALRKNCGDRPVERGDFKAIVGSLDYSCAIGLEETAIADAAAVLRGDPKIVPLLRLRVAELETQVFDFRQNNKGIVEGLRKIVERKQ